MAHTRYVSEEEVTRMLRELFEASAKADGEAWDHISSTALRPNGDIPAFGIHSAGVSPTRRSAIPQQRQPS